MHEQARRTRSIRIQTYVEKLADIFPAEYLTHLLITSQTHNTEELIRIYEADKARAIRLMIEALSSSDTSFEFLNRSNAEAISGRSCRCHPFSCLLHP
jgi:hypothetical protein